MIELERRGLDPDQDWTRVRGCQSEDLGRSYQSRDEFLLSFQLPFLFLSLCFIFFHGGLWEGSVYQIDPRWCRLR